jgi:Sensors of blue-light using FAD
MKWHTPRNTMQLLMFHPSSADAGAYVKVSVMTLARIVYRSENAMNVAGNRILIHYNDIVSSARRHNTQKNITGFLMFDRERYHQIIEGEAADVETLYARIVTDPRHRNLEILSHASIDVRDFTDWSMGSFLSDGNTHPLLAKYAIKPRQPVDADSFLKFAIDFTADESRAA